MHSAAETNAGTRRHSERNLQWMLMVSYGLWLIAGIGAFGWRAGGAAAFVVAVILALFVRRTLRSILSEKQSEAEHENELERRIAERTEQLESANRRLTQEIREKED